MLKLNRRRFLTGSLAALAGLALPGLARAEGPQAGPSTTPQGPQVGPLITPQVSQTRLFAQSDYTRPPWFPQNLWKAVYIVGDTDNYGPGTADYIARGKEIAAALKGQGLAVAEFYPPTNHWADIKAAALDASILIYNGHGVGWDGDPNKVGGFCLRPDEFIRPEQIATELKLLTGAWVFLFACYAAGSPGGETYCAPATAYNRVVQYATPFLQAGAHGYYALWDPYYPERATARLQAGARFTDPYWECSFFQTGHADNYAHPTIPGVSMHLGWDGDGTTTRTYTTAFVGYDQERFRDTFGPKTIYMPIAARGGRG